MEYSKVSNIVASFVAAVQEERLAKGYDSDAAASFTLGYLESTLCGILASMPEKAAKRELLQLAQVTSTKTAKA